MECLKEFQGVLNQDGVEVQYFMARVNKLCVCVCVCIWGGGGGGEIERARAAAVASCGMP